MQLVRELHATIYPESQLIVYCNKQILYDQDQKSYLFRQQDLDALDQLGPFLCVAEDDGKYTYAINTTPEISVLGIFHDPAKVGFIELRFLLGLIDPLNFKLVARSSMLATWIHENKFCSMCGQRNEFNEREGAYDCKCSNLPKYPSISPCIITLVHDEDRILLGRNKFFPEGMYSTLAGFIEAGENAEEALEREVMEEVNVTVEAIRYFHSQSWPFPSQLMLGYFCQYKAGEIQLNDEELEDAQWFNIKSLPIVPPDSSISGQLIRSYIEDRSQL